MEEYETFCKNLPTFDQWLYQQYDYNIHGPWKEYYSRREATELYLTMYHARISDMKVAFLESILFGMERGVKKKDEDISDFINENQE